ncbi:MAG: ATPase, T2SS/T4P/T4SS family [Clostridiales bacterium]|nr:ATPase, T2SS/T4P/T4SS family [Clostridiales bacterium]
MEQNMFEQAVDVLCDNIKGRLQGIAGQIKNNAIEIRMRTGLPLMINMVGESVFLLKNGGVTCNNRPGVYLITDEDIQQSFRKICGYSVHSYQNEICNGYLTVKGNRIGFCGTAVVEDGKITTLRKITSLNIRIARQIHNTADQIVSLFHQKGLCGVLILGAPATGKTTMLKDLVRQLANGSIGRFVQISVVDERGEIAGERGDPFCNDLGVSSDVLSGYPKGKGMETAIRTMAPEMIVCDEIGSREDAAAVAEAVNSGVKVVATMHAGSMEEFLRKPIAKPLLDIGAFDYVFVLDGSGPKCLVKQVFDLEHLRKGGGKAFSYDQNIGNDFCGDSVGVDRTLDVLEFIKKGE